MYLSGNLTRYILEQRKYQRELDEAGKSGDKAKYSQRGNSVRARGLSVEFLSAAEFLR